MHGTHPSALSELYPEIEPFDHGYLKVDDLHEIYWEQSGNPRGVPVLFLHGGPGAGAGPAHRRFFDPKHYRIVIFDQRGSGRSKPLGEVRNNTTPLLIQDIETLRQKFGIARWHVFGGSWGSTLALAYAEYHPDQVLSLCLRGIFLCRKSEIDWFLYGLRTMSPDTHRAFVETLPLEERADILGNYYRRLLDPDPAIYKPAARAWGLYEGVNCTLLPDPGMAASFASERVSLGLARLEAHYFINNIFLPDNFLLDHVDRIRHIPAFVVHGKYDLVCPIVSAYDLVERWPEAEFTVAPDAGHSAFEPPIRSALVNAMERFKKIPA